MISDNKEQQQIPKEVASTSFVQSYANTVQKEGEKRLSSLLLATEQSTSRMSVHSRFDLPTDGTNPQSSQLQRSVLDADRERSMQTLLNTTVEEMEEPFVPSSSFITRNSLLPALKPRIESLNELSTIEDRSVINPSEETFIVDNDDLSIEASRLSKGEASRSAVADDFGAMRELRNEPRTHFAIAKNDQLITMRGRSYQNDSDEGSLEEINYRNSGQYLCL